jgi:endo-1,4-beta-xylanase
MKATTHDSQGGALTAARRHSDPQTETSVTTRAGTSRREFVAGALVGTIACSLPEGAFADEFRPIKAVAAQKGILFGSSVGAEKPGTQASSFHDPRYLEILKKECSVIVPENELKSGTIAAERDRYNFAPGDEIAGFARSNGLKLRGHNLLWNRTEYIPKWLREWFGGLSREAAEQYLRGYIRQVCTHYRDQIHSWDVVNEAVDTNTGEICDTPFTRVLGFDVMRIAYEAAREAAPHAQLVYNDYMSWKASSEAHRAGVLRLLEKLKKSNVPIDALGVQSHLGGGEGDPTPQTKAWKAFVDEVVGMGYSLAVTELDINDRNLASDIKQRDAQVAAMTRDYLDIMLSYRQLDQVLCWGMVDKYSWLRWITPRPGQPPERPNPYDDRYQSKPMREAIFAAFTAAPARP